MDTKSPAKTTLDRTSFTRSPRGERGINVVDQLSWNLAQLDHWAGGTSLSEHWLYVDSDVSALTFVYGEKLPRFRWRQTSDASVANPVTLTDDLSHGVYLGHR